MYTRGIDVDREGRLAEPSSSTIQKSAGQGLWRMIYFARASVLYSE